MNTPTARWRREAAAAWIDYCERLKEAAQLFAREEIPVQELDLTEGLRYLAHLTAASVERFIDAANPAEPRLYLLCDERIKSGGDNPDNRYYVAAVSDAYQYELRGLFQSCDYYSVIALDRKDMSAGLSAEERERRGARQRVDSSTLRPEADGSVRISISAGAAFRSNYLPIDEYTNLILIRCTFEAKPPRQIDLSIRRVDGRPTLSRPDLRGIKRQLAQAAEHVVGISRFFGEWTAGFQRHVNELPLGDQDYIRSTGGDPNILYYLSAWSLAPGQALVVRIPEIPPCITWNFQLCNVWLESLDYSKARIHTNATRAVRDLDEGVTIVVSGEDPAHPNWLDTTGHAAGTMCMRFTGAVSVPRPQTTIVPLTQAQRLHERLAQ